MERLASDVGVDEINCSTYFRDRSDLFGHDDQKGRNRYREPCRSQRFKFDVQGEFLFFGFNGFNGYHGHNTCVRKYKDVDRDSGVRSGKR